MPKKLPPIKDWKNLSQLCKEMWLNYATIYQRMKKWLSFDEAVSSKDMRWKHGNSWKKRKQLLPLWSEIRWMKIIGVKLVPEWKRTRPHYVFQCEECWWEFSCRADRKEKKWWCWCSRLWKMKHWLSNHKLYRIFDWMKSRCYNDTTAWYKNYGGRWITICDKRLNDVWEFIRWWINAWRREWLCIDRINNNGWYSPENCRFVSYKINNNNKRNNIIFDGKSLKEREKETWVKPSTVYNRICNWREIERAILTPVAKYRTK